MNLNPASALALICSLYEQLEGSAQREAQAIQRAEAAEAALAERATGQ